MAKFRKKPIEIEAYQYCGGFKPNHWPEWLRSRLVAWDASLEPGDVKLAGETLCIHTLEGTMVAHFGDWIIKGVKGELYPVKNDIFLATYEAVDAD
jgi:hypothetical protein